MVTTERETKIKAGYKLTELGVIPEEWRVTKLSEVADVKTGPFGSTLHEKDYVDNGTPIITVEHLGERGVIHENLPMVSEFDRKRLSAYSLLPGDIVFSRVGSVDRNSLIKQEEGGWLFSGRLLRIRQKTPNIYSPFLSYYFHQETTKQRIRAVAVGQTMASLNTQILRNIEVAFPPTTSEQTAIATALRDVDALITSLDKLIAKKRDVKQATMQQLLTGRVRLPGSCGEWEEKKLGDVVEIILGGGTPSRSKPEYWEGNIPWVTVKDFATFNSHFTQESITEVGLQNSASNLIKKGTIIISTRMAIGKAVIYEIDVSINQDLKAIFLKKDINVLFVFYWFEQNVRSIENLGGGSTVKGVSLSDLKNVPFLKPPTIYEQAAIATVLSGMDAEIASLEQKRDKTRALKQGMMQELLTGRIRLV